MEEISTTGLSISALYWILFIAIAIASYVVQGLLQNRFARASKIVLRNGMSGADVARAMLEHYGIKDVQVLATRGHLTDHYNPLNKTLNLSESVYSSCSVAAAAVAAHECGHAVQHACGYFPLKIRSALVPAVNFSSRFITWLLLIGMLTISIYPQIMLAGIVLFALTTLFSFITLPVEINASKRALTWLMSAGITDAFNHDQACSTLRWAAYTYVVAALSSLATLIYYILLFASGSRRD